MIIFNIGYSVCAAILGVMVILVGLVTEAEDPALRWISVLLGVGFGLMIIGSIWMLEW